MKHRYVPLNWIQWLTLLLAAATALGFAYFAHGQNVQGANQAAVQARLSRQSHELRIVQRHLARVQAHQNDALHSIICRAEHYLRTQPGIPAKQRRQGIRFYEDALTGAHLQPCTD